jgi:hypothetical protein
MRNNFVCRAQTPRRARVVQGQTTPFNYSRILDTPEGLVRNISARIPGRVISPNAQRPAQRPHPRRYNPAPAFAHHPRNNPATSIARANRLIARVFRQTAEVVAQVKEMSKVSGARLPRSCLGHKGAGRHEN